MCIYLFMVHLSACNMDPSLYPVLILIIQKQSSVIASAYSTIILYFIFYTSTKTDNVIRDSDMFHIHPNL
jgi:hypothetical protein